MAFVYERPLSFEQMLSSSFEKQVLTAKPILLELPTMETKPSLMEKCSDLADNTSEGHSETTHEQPSDANP